MNFIKKVIDGNTDSFSHIQFQKFSKGEFKERAFIAAKQSKGKYTISTTPEFANEMVYSMAKKLGGDKTNITGALVSTSDLTGELEFKDKKQFQGVKRYLIDNEMSGDQIISLLKKFPKSFFALSFKIGDNVLKIKPKAPKSGKPKSKNGEKPKSNFCKLVTIDKELGEGFVIESDNWKKAEIFHDFIIENIEIPAELKGSKDFAKIREESLRVGKIIRHYEIDGVENSREYDLRA